MIRLQVVDAADVAFRVWCFSQPRAAADIVARFGIDPEIVHTLIADLYRLHSCQDILPPRRLPSLDVGRRCTGRKRTAHVDAAVSALPALESDFSHKTLHIEQPGDKVADNQDQQKGGNHRLAGGVAHTDRPLRGGKSLVTGDNRDDDPE